ncbi:putative protein kinase domain-containing protein [Phaeomoniella chlamydospora]|uniref:Protein kinase domain-containing protein n=1 Tax=Phaeomoniella chlamydospora TaxID=158046 RepID=A0A0G2EKK6_PHACM|nr:putative protein kinase domain-containing protein [Phaeomoniella chlamydospora]
MPPPGTTLWTDERINATINRQFVLEQLTPDEQSLVARSLSFGDTLTDDTYLDWILYRAKRFFLILTDIGIPDQIFGIVDENYDDNDLPIALEAVPQLRLSYEPDKALDRKFYKAQFRFLCKDIRAGEHIRFGVEETIPLEPVVSRSGISLHKDDTDKVVLPGIVAKTYTRRKVALEAEPSCWQEDDVLAEVASLSNFTHEHITSIFASYAEANNFYALFTPAPEYTLKAFLGDSPKSFESLPKPVRRETLINWPHCLASALAWLHSKGRCHGAIRPSNIYIDSEFRIFFGYFSAFNILLPNAKVDDIEAYQYAAPEKWKRAATAQATGAAKTLGNSGGRTARKPPSARPSRPLEGYQTSMASQTSFTKPAVDTLQPTDTAVAFIPSSRSRVKLSDYQKMTQRPRTSRSNHETASLVSSTSSGTKRSLPALRSLAQRAKPAGQPLKNASATPSIVSSQESTHAVPHGPIPDPIAVPAAEVRTAIVQTWQSAEHDPFPSDIFTFGAISLDILSFLCKRSMSSFARHRSSKNRTAGRGGGLADASFHANLGQLYSWCKQLDQDARKRATKSDGSAFAAVKPMLEVILKCIEKEPSARVTAGTLEESLADAIWRHANVGQLHCTNLVDKLDQMTMSDAQPSPIEHVLTKFESHSSNQLAERSNSIPENEMVGPPKKPIRSRFGLPVEPTISHGSRNTGRSISTTSPFGYFGPKERRSSDKSRLGFRDDADSDTRATSTNTSIVDLDKDYETLDMKLDEERSHTNGSLRSVSIPPTPAESRVSEAPPVVSLNRISQFKLELPNYGQDSAMAPKSSTIPELPESGLTREAQEAESAESTDDNISTSDRPVSRLSAYTAVSSTNSNPHFSWGWTAPSPGYKMSETGSLAPPSPKVGRQNIRSAGARNDKRLSQATPADEMEEMPDRLPRQMRARPTPPPLPLHSKPLYRALSSSDPNAAHSSSRQHTRNARPPSSASSQASSVYMSNSAHFSSRPSSLTPSHDPSLLSKRRQAPSEVHEDETHVSEKEASRNIYDNGDDDIDEEAEADLYAYGSGLNAIGTSSVPSSGKPGEIIPSNSQHGVGEIGQWRRGDGGRYYWDNGAE